MCIIKESYFLGGCHVRQWFSDLFKNVTPPRVLVFGFAGIILLGAFLLSLPFATHDGNIGLLDALFTATSATCVNGLVVVDTGTNFTIFGQLVVLAMIQVGGLGFMTMSTLMAIILGKRIGLRERLVLQESLNLSSLDGMVRLARKIILFTFVIEGLGGALLCLRLVQEMPFGQALYFGIFHSVSAFCNAGFDLFGIVHGPFNSISNYSSDAWISLTIVGLFIIGGLGFPVIFEFMQKNVKKRISVHTRLVLAVSIVLLVLGTLSVLLLEYNNPYTLATLSGPAKVLASFFQAATPRSAGFRTLDIGRLKDSTQFLLLILMFIGASPSSTGGGIKTTTFGVLMAAVWATVRGREDAEMYERRMPKDIIYKAFSLTVIALTMIFIVTMLLSITENFSFLRILFEVTSAIGTAGLSTGITPFLSSFARVLIIFSMFAGRVGLLTIAFALTQRLQSGSVRYMEERLMIG
jgi:trk system potassium uptake protein TrkH